MIDKIRKLPADIRYFLDQTTIENGVRESIILLQRACGVDTTGCVDDETVEAAQLPGILEIFAVYRYDLQKKRRNFNAYRVTYLEKIGKDTEEAKRLLANS
jgi:lysozyme family protein